MTRITDLARHLMTALVSWYSIDEERTEDERIGAVVSESRRIRQDAIDQLRKDGEWADRRLRRKR